MRLGLVSFGIGIFVAKIASRKQDSLKTFSRNVRGFFVSVRRANHMDITHPILNRMFTSLQFSFLLSEEFHGFSSM